MSVNATVLAVCVNWNGQEVLAETLSSLLKSDYPQLDVLVVDNDSRDGSLACIPPSVKTLRLMENRGYGAALNAAVRLVEGQQPWLEGQQPEPPSGSLARPDYYLMLNNDMVLEESMVGELVQFARRKGKAILGPKILRYHEPNRLEAAWGRVDWSHVLASSRAREPPMGRTGVNRAGPSYCWAAPCSYPGRFSSRSVSLMRTSSCTTKKWISSTGPDGKAIRSTTVPLPGPGIAASTEHENSHFKRCFGHEGTRSTF